jgi:hypothetical protein
MPKFPDGGTQPLEYFSRPVEQYQVTIDEGQRQMILMALAHLAVERPGFDYALSEIASLMDNESPAGPQLYGSFKEIAFP